jgi:NhaP-type Na+/H+ or K+/H+ antiporter
MLLGSLALAATIVGSDHIFHLHIMHWFRSTFAAANLPRFFLDGPLALLLFAGSLQVGLKELNRRRWLILRLATESVILSTAIFGVGMSLTFAAVGLVVPRAWCFPCAILESSSRICWKSCRCRPACAQPSSVRACSMTAPA